MGNEQHKVIVVGVVVHILPENLSLFKEQITASPYVVRLIRFQESDNKLWIVDRENDTP